MGSELVNGHKDSSGVNGGICTESSSLLSLPSGCDDRLDRPRHDRSVGALIAGIAGNVMEWYDFAIFGAFADIIGAVFFPHPDGTGGNHTALVESFVIFGGAFAARPVGGIMMGYIGDLYGSKTALELSVFMMALPTFLMGCLPSYGAAGTLSVVLLITVRLAQGISAGGQLVSSLVFTVERAPRDRCGLYGSLVMASANSGTLLGVVVATGLRYALSWDQLVSWGWRFPFWGGILVSFSGFYLKYHVAEERPHRAAAPHPRPSVDESPSLPPSPSPHANPILLALDRNHRWHVLATFFVSCLWAGCFYVTFIWMPIFMSVIRQPPLPNSYATTSVVLLATNVAFFPVAGYLSDVLGRRRLMAAAGMAVALLARPMLAIIDGGPEAVDGNYFSPTILLAHGAMGLALALYGAPMCAHLVESVPDDARLTVVSVGYNLALMVVGGSAPAVSTIVCDAYGMEGVANLFAGVACVGVCGVLLGSQIKS
mmetsp:Transcript_30508/g.47194  ORF Transcript_30508/g.47194 Transcript_30508/m.47194 type:complete len:485 (-) Transcript_30508:133-1587(-)|eukprot:CAMPEP_0194292454 /NCGR_PEP_ID=MMETSP0169-20130528/45666_1 /TAXON_ID=218684 /ORGANISM="Corethron pennatum, Strain L29A3" /LENGTH=484 /DNA_ID=CAMNT_0039040637 /DNA_START=24 /DNA_END=1478 /DNA_ORIENTATION=-